MSGLRESFKDVQSSISEIERFKESRVWADIKSSLEIFIHNTAFTEMCSPEVSEAGLRFCQGRIDSAKFLLELPELLLGEIAMKEDELEKEEELGENNA